jgi:hypothetical protein
VLTKSTGIGLCVSSMFLLLAKHELLGQVEDPSGLEVEVQAIQLEVLLRIFPVKRLPRECRAVIGTI